MSLPWILMQLSEGSIAPIVIIVVIILVVLMVVTLVIKQYRRCPANRVLAVWGKIGGEKAAKCLHGGGVFIVPLLQDYAYLSLEPITITT